MTGRTRISKFISILRITWIQCVGVPNRHPAPLRLISPSLDYCFVVQLLMTWTVVISCNVLPVIVKQYPLAGWSFQTYVHVGFIVPTVAQQFHFVLILFIHWFVVLSAFLFARQRQKFKCSLCIAIISLVETTNRPSPDCISHVGLCGLGHPRSQGQSDSTAVCRQVAAGSCQDDMAKNGALCSACFCKRLKFFIWTYIGFMTVWSYTHAHTR